MNKKNYVTLLALLLFTTAFAGGFRVSLQGVRQAAMAHTSAHVRDASVIFFNPAGMAFIDEKLSISAGAFGTFINSEYQNPSTLYSHETDNDVSTPFYFGAAYKVTDMISLGVSVTTPYGNTVKWGDNWAGSELVQDIELKAFQIQPTLAVKFTDWFSAGLGFIHTRGSVTLNRAINSVGGKLTIDDSDASGNGFNVGAYFRPSKKLDISLAYRSKVDMDAVDGDATFNVPSSLVGSAPFLTTNDKFSATLPLASEFTAGISYQVLEKLKLAADINVTGWQAYRNLTLDFDQNLVGNTEDLTVSSTPKNFEVTNTYRVGAEYNATPQLDLRLGYYFDESPVQYELFSPETPSTDNHYLTTGFGYTFKKGLHIDAFGSYLFGEVLEFNNTSQGFSGQVKNSGFILGFGLTYNAF